MHNQKYEPIIFIKKESILNKISLFSYDNISKTSNLRERRVKEYLFNNINNTKNFFGIEVIYLPSEHYNFSKDIRDYLNLIDVEYIDFK